MGAGSGPWTEPGAFPVAPGVHRVPLPLPNDGLHAVNVYAVESADGLVLIDSGWALQEARDLLESSLGSIGYGFEDIGRFLITHMHRDHYTLAVELRRMFGARIALGVGEQPNFDAVRGGSGEAQLAEIARWGAADLVEKLRGLYTRDNAEQAKATYELPDDWIPGAQDIEIGDRTLRAVPTPGHTRGHVVFADPAASLLFSGDHVLPHITPSIGFEPARAELPLGAYLDSLRLMRTLPDMRLLPAHGPVTDSVHTRVDELLLHHEERLAATEAVVREGAATAFEAANRLTWTRRGRAFDELDTFNRTLAVGETAAHLDVLVVRGELKSSTVDGVVEYVPLPGDQTA
ncbi:Glyoxylase, beta-lactamase superfamily II [Actinokineospora alba]|uniref:Glyoxylase, beta-lactamase superfamily II n=1 Tax=Actinokineospora alba TaxID=504798 RepID=A0A1H0M2U5_9PSEU|nr:MBL fold metallo-hydrolase [Actinokineospora alba]TDP67565.1 glyoxylase-like metal-dependent hydrolase (beta-lactamase superfamily II) [Actinokineospora alba]SDI45397.1 Glyoxylase, beta-lactamase superfamily II [Actinokineospora alba]SDO74727.1 Glyoxylase, beta-lactamase superfamily II [Actinokineospora alba]